MATVHTVSQGEHLSRIAKQYGFANYLTVWDHPQNAGLKQKRLNPNVLHPGDQVFIPDTQVRDEVRSAGKLHSFVMERPPLKLRLVVEDQYHKPIANTPCTLVIDSDSRSVTTDANGKLEEDLPADTDSATLIIENAENPADSIEIPISIGHLDPVEEFSGQRVRLFNLAYLARGEQTEEDSEDFRSAVEEFQCDNKLTVDGICGPITQAKLKKVHGC